MTSSGTGLTLTPTANFEVIAQESNKTAAQVAQEFNAFQTLLQTYDAGKQHVSEPAAAHRQQVRRVRHAMPAARGEYARHPATELANRPTSVRRRYGHASDGPGTRRAGRPADRRRQLDRPIGTPAPARRIPVAGQVGRCARHAAAVRGDPAAGRLDLVGRRRPFRPCDERRRADIVYDPDGIIYFYDRQTDTTITIATPGDGLTYSGQTISSDGRYVVYPGHRRHQSYIFVCGTDPSDTAHYQHTTQLVAGGAPAI